ncbi:MAG: Nif3-like dinuclear metal center hexameric protein [Candidatus Dadabacteria bacterium]|nr:Nif3-like dinuclear metal center hexameric protein [Candidatus Dadabacteria bacterium]
MPTLKKIVGFLDKYLKIDDIQDSSWNGLQFEGGSKVEKIALAVDASAESFEKAAQENAELLIVHHGHFWQSHNPSISGWSKERVTLLYRNNLSLYACHLPLDRHKEVGNNAELLKLLGAPIKKEFLFHKGKNIGWIGERKRAISLSDIEQKLNDNLKTSCIVLPFGKNKIKTIAVCSGGGSYGGFYEALALNADLYITGDTAEVYYTAQDAGMNVIFAGHHATETVGLKALSKVVNKKFKIETVFIDLPTGL